jgi:methanogenic corrinoid protein MtbC1
MKKLFLLSIVFALLSCSSGDDDNTSNSTNSDLVGAWFTTFTDDGNTAEQTLILLSDGTGSVSNIWDYGETFNSEIIWSATASEFSMTTLIDDEANIADYELSNNNNTLVFRVNENVIYTFTRI